MAGAHFLGPSRPQFFPPLLLVTQDSDQLGFSSPGKILPLKFNYGETDIRVK